jgi:hypothetical protein
MEDPVNAKGIGRDGDDSLPKQSALFDDRFMKWQNAVRDRSKTNSMWHQIATTMSANSADHAYTVGAGTLVK